MEDPMRLASSSSVFVSSGENIWSACTDEARPEQGADFFCCSA